MTSIDSWLNALGPAAPVLVFLLAAGESAAFLGLFLPGEVTIVLGGVLAGASVVPLWVMLGAAVGGAVVGDSVGYWLGHRLGPTVLGRPRLRSFAEGLGRAQEQLGRRGWWALVVARFTSVLRAVVPFAAGMGNMPYRRFLLGNVVGGILWGTTYTLIGYLAGNAWPTVEHWLGRGGLIAAAVALLGFAVVWSFRWVGSHPDLVVGWLQRNVLSRLPSPIATGLQAAATRVWAARILVPAAVGFVAAFWLFAGLLQDVVGVEEFFFFDRRAVDYAATHRLPALLTGAEWVLRATSGRIILLVVAAWTATWLWRREWRPTAAGLLALGGQWLLVELTHRLVSRPPPAVVPLAARGDYGFPSEPVAAVAALALVLAWPWRPRGWRRTSLMLAFAELATLITAAARFTLGIEYPSDVLAGWAAGMSWALLAALTFDRRTVRALGALMRGTRTNLPT